MFELVQGGKAKAMQRKERQMELYKQEYFNYKYGYKKEACTKKAVFYGVKYYAKIQIDTCDYKGLLLVLLEIKDIKTMLSFLSINEIINIFPVTKSYDGKQYECKDFFSTKEYLDNKRHENIIGIDGIEDFLWNYYNNDIMNFSIKEMLVIDRLRRAEGKKGMLESFMEDIGEELHTYTVDRTNNKAYDNITGEEFEIMPVKDRELDLETEKFQLVLNNANSN